MKRNEFKRLLPSKRQKSQTKINLDLTDKTNLRNIIQILQSLLKNNASLTRTTVTELKRFTSTLDRLAGKTKRR